MRCGAVQTRGVLGESKTSERFEACCIRLAGGRKGGKQLAAGQSLVGIHQPRKGTPVSSTNSRVVMWMGCERRMCFQKTGEDGQTIAVAAIGKRRRQQERAARPG